ncbi:hypothetical protein D1872_240970 [compost metagenome]
MGTDAALVLAVDFGGDRDDLLLIIPLNARGRVNNVQFGDLFQIDDRAAGGMERNISELGQAVHIGFIQLQRSGIRRIVQL